MSAYSLVVSSSRLQRMRALLPSRRLQAKVDKLVKGLAVTFTIAEVSDLRVASRQTGRPLARNRVRRG